MSVIPVVFMGTADFAVSSLQACIEDDHYDVVAVISQPDRPAGRKMQLKASPVKELALKHGIEVFTPESVNTEESIQKLRSYQAEIGIVVAFGQILKQEVIDSFERGCVNIHGSLLPRWRGAAPIQRALMAGDEESGVSLQKIDLALDAGDLIGVRRVKLTDDIDAPILYDILKAKGAELIHLELMDYIRGNLSLERQDPELVTVAKKLKKEDAEINWELPAREIFNRYRGMKMWPGSLTYRDGKMLKIHNMKPSGGSGKPGEVIETGKDYFVVACGKDALVIYEVQPENKAKMSAEAYQAGKAFTKGEVLGK
jgi:methionyl-tRNA formyltransferase